MGLGVLDVVRDELGHGKSADGAQCQHERVLVEAGVVLLREREQFVAGVAAGAEDGVDVDEVACLGSGVEGADLVGNGVVGM